MVDVTLLKSEMVKHGYTQEKLAKRLGITPRTLSNRLKKREFLSSEIGIMIQCFQLEDPMPIFFKRDMS